MFLKWGTGRDLNPRPPGTHRQRRRQDMTQSILRRESNPSFPSDLPLIYLSKCPSFRAVGRLSGCRVFPL